MISYVVLVDDGWYSYIQFYKWALALSKVNKRRVKCIECRESFEPGECVYQSQYTNNGYVCIPCTRMMILKYGEMGYSENIMQNLQANILQTGKWQARIIADALKMDTITDGHGNEWDARCDKCESRSMQVERPGLARCKICEG